MTFAPHVDGAALQRLIDETSSPLLVHFTAEWCGPCQGMAPFLEAFASARADSLPVVRVDIDSHPDVAARFMVRAVPTLYVLQDGRVLGAHTGALSGAQLARFVHASIGE
jgi:thioredoxin 1